MDENRRENTDRSGQVQPGHLVNTAVLMLIKWLFEHTPTIYFVDEERFTSETNTGEADTPPADR